MDEPCARCGEPYTGAHFLLDVVEGRTTRPIVLCLSLIDDAPSWEQPGVSLGTAKAIENRWSGPWH